MLRRHLDLGCGSTPRNPLNQDELFGVDLSAPVGDSHLKRVDLCFEPLPFETSSFDSISAYDFIEHIPRVLNDSVNRTTQFPFVDLMNEIYRVLKPEGRFLASTPCYPHPHVFVDPTHVNFISIRSHTYFCGCEPLARIYGFKGHFEPRTVLLWRPRKELLLPPSAPTLRQRIHRFIDSIRRKNSHVLWDLVAVKEKGN